MSILLVILVILLAIAGFVIYDLYKRMKVNEKKLQNSGQAIKPMTELEAIEKASSMAKQKLLEAENEANRLLNETKTRQRTLEEKIQSQEKNLDLREKQLLQRANNLDARFDELEKKEDLIEKAKLSIKELRESLETELEKVANLTKQEAEQLLKKEVEEDLLDWKAKKIKEIEEKTKFDADEISRNILIETMQNSAVDYVTDTTTTTVEIDDESLKSRIIGKSGRNVRTLEKLTGVDVIIDDSPNEVTISCFDPIRREVGALVLKKLLKTGKINPASIEEAVEKVKKDILKEVKQTGEMIAYESGFNDLPNEILMLLGRFKYRFSYGQNLVKHTLEMVKIAEALALELGADVKTSKLASLLHDIGKVMPQEGKQHHHISSEIAQKYYKDNERLINAIEAHHFDIDAKFIEAEIIRIADAISGARPGARIDTYEDYVKRVRALEDIANKQKGVKESFAIQAGREVRVIVKPEEISDSEAKVMAHEVAKEIEETQNYPGVVKVNVIREFRVVEEAK